MKKAKVKRNFIKIPVSNKILFGRDRVVDMTGNANFLTPIPSLATVTTVTNNLETKHLASEGGGPAQTVARDAAEEVWNSTLRKLADYVDGIADGDTVKITSAGFHTTKTEASPRHVPAQPTGQKFIHTDESGAVIFTCNAVPSSETYVAVLSPDFAALKISTIKTQLMFRFHSAENTPDVLLTIDVSSQRKKIIRGLESGKRIYGKIYCTNSAGRGIDSDVISVMVG
ncbi:MAG: hypothetical protein HY841_14930 [Bacteroidetes bacterium]|nr:hypothetical protein [Bacteroidota bacterium]